MFCAIKTQKGDKSVMVISAKAAKDSDRKQSFERLELVPKVAIPQCGNVRFSATYHYSLKILREINFGEIKVPKLTIWTVFTQSLLS